MNPTQDPYDLLTSLRPNRSVDDAWPPEQRDACLDRVLADSPAFVAPRPPRLRRRTAVVLLAAIGLFAAGSGVAAAGGRLPEWFTRPFSSWKHDVGVDPQTVVRVAGIPGPDGSVFTVWTARGANGVVCVASGFESRQSASSAVPTHFDANGATCAPAGRTTAFGDGLAINADQRRHTFDVGAGDKVRAEVHLGDGTVLPVAHVEGYFLGWYPSAHTGTAPELVAYDAAGRPATLPLRYLD
jgi:hypothetical protein